MIIIGKEKSNPALLLTGKGIFQRGPVDFLRHTALVRGERSGHISKNIQYRNSLCKYSRAYEPQLRVSPSIKT